MDWYELVGGGGGIGVVALAVGRWLGARSAERRDLMQQTLERVAHLEGRSDVLQQQLASAQQALADERASCAGRIAQLEARIAVLEHELDDERSEVARLRALRRSPTPPRPMEAVE